jgi:hypothetical protein
MKFPGDAITAIGINPLNPHTVYAASLNPFYHRWGLYKLMGKTEWKLLMPQPYDSRLFRFNCLAVSPVDSNLVLAGTDQGLMVSRDGGANWEHRSGLSVSSLQFFENQIFLSTNNNPPSRSDGIYVSIDKASNWEVWSWWTYCVEMATTRRQEKNKPAYFFLADSSRGVFVTREAPHNWQDISDGLGKAQATCLARNLSNPPSLVVGTTKGLFKYVDISTSVFPAFENRSQAPTMLRLIFNYPNPFNAETKISFIVDRNLSHVKLNIYNSLGQQIKILFAGSKAQGEYSIKWDGKNDDGYSMPSGVYFCRIELEGQKISWTKMVLLR